MINLHDSVKACLYGLTIDRDLNAAINIRRKGTKKLKEPRYAEKVLPKLRPWRSVQYLKG